MAPKSAQSQVEINQPEVVIDPEFQKLLPVLTPEEYKNLEDDIRANGCRDNLIVGVFNEEGEDKTCLIDGHNRFRICKEHNKSYGIQEPLRFTDREAVVTWIIENQTSRRNMSKFRWAELSLKFKDRFSKEGKENQKKGGKGYQKSDNPVRTLERLEKYANASHDTLYKVETILNKASQEDIDRLRSGDPDISINSVYLKCKDKSNRGDGSKIDLGSDENNKRLKKIFGNKLDTILTALGELEQSLEKKKDISAIQSLTAAIKKIVDKI